MEQGVCNNEFTRKGLLAYFAHCVILFGVMASQVRCRRNSIPVAPPHRSQICAAIVTYDIGEAIHRCFDAIHSQVGHVLIVDNGSGETTRRELAEIAASNSVTLILNQRNEGVGHAYNQAFAGRGTRGFNGS